MLRQLEEHKVTTGQPMGVINGTPYWFWLTGERASAPEVNPEIAALVSSLHIADNGVYIATDLEVHAAALKTALGAESPEWAAYLAIQTSLIRERRRELYMDTGGCNTIYLETVSDGGTFTAAKDAAVAAKAAAKALYPWPGAYR